MIRAVLFDVDDTLVDYQSAERQGIESYLRELGVPGSLSAAARVWNRLQEKHFERFLAGRVDYVGQASALAADMLAWLRLPRRHDPYTWFLGYREHYERRLTTFPDVPDALQSLAGVPLGVVTNSSTAYTQVKLQRVGLQKTFECVVGVDVTGTSKPGAEIFHAGCAALGVAPEEAVYVGDQLDSDVDGANAAGLRGVWINRAGAGGRGLSDLRELPAWLEENGWVPSSGMSRE